MDVAYWEAYPWGKFTMIYKYVLCWRQQSTVSYVLSRKSPCKPPKKNDKIRIILPHVISLKLMLPPEVSGQIDMLFDGQVQQQQQKQLCSYHIATIPKEQEILSKLLHYILMTLVQDILTSSQ